MNDLERCAGCDQSARVDTGGHPYVGVMNADDAQAIGYDIAGMSERGFIDVPVCSNCWSKPEHRVRALKCHFFPRAQRHTARAQAGSNSIST